MFKRPNIPFAVRVAVSERMMLQRGIPPHTVNPQTQKPLPLIRRLLLNLHDLFGEAKVHLDHDPALVNRPCDSAGRYRPDANNPDYLIYRTAANHDIKTRVSGEHGQHSDLALRRKRKRAERKKQRKRSTRKLQSANRWPPKGTRKLCSRPFQRRTRDVSRTKS